MLDVPLLMQDLTVEQLVQIQYSFDQEIENKKEELRQMVGRRYRDVLDASNTVKRLTEISNDLVVELEEIGKASAISSTENTNNSITTFRKDHFFTHHFVLLNSLLPQIGTTNDSLGDVFCLLLAENFHRQLASQATKMDHGDLSKLLFNQLLGARLDLVDGLLSELGQQTDWQVVAGQLAALALLKQLEVNALLDTYLQARMDTIFINLKSSSTSLIGIIQMMKATTQAVNDVFGQGEAILSVLKTITHPGWCPESVSMLVNDQLHCYNQIFSQEIVKINAAYTPKIALLKIGEVEKRCSEWIEKMCSMASHRVRSLCNHFEQTQQVVEFVAAINQIFKSEWSGIASNLSIYQRLFGNSLFDQFRLLIHKELSLLEQDLLAQLPQVNSNPMPLFQKRAVKFDVLLASGVSHELNDLVQKMFDGMRQLLANVNKYVSLRKEQEDSDTKASLHDALADAVLDLVNRLLVYFGINYSGESSANIVASQQPHEGTVERKSKWLIAFRLFLSFVQHEPSVFCLCMNRDVEKIVRCNKTLHQATEMALCHYMDFVIEDCVENSKLAQIPRLSTLFHLWLDLVQANEKTNLVEGIDISSSVDVPSQLSRHYFHFLYHVCLHINNDSIGHLFTRNVIADVSRKLGQILSTNLKQCAEVCSSAPLICTQLLFDCRALFLMFPVNKGFVEAAELLQAKIDPFELKLLSTPISKNAKLFVQRTTMVFGQLQVEPMTCNSKESSNLNSSYSALVDITPKITDVRRLTLIPRLSKLRGNDQERVQKAVSTGPQDTNTLTTAAKSGLESGIASTSSFSSLLYDKISTGWFKN